MPAKAYLYELRRGDEILATGHVTLEEEPVAGSLLRIGRHEGVVCAVEAIVRGTARRIRVELRADAAYL